MRTKRQNIQLELALEPEAKGEARSTGDRGTEVRVACADPESPADGRRPSMEAVVEPGNLRKALARVQRNKGAPGIDGMTAAARITGMPSLTALSTRLSVMPEPGKAMRPFGRRLSSSSLRRKGAALP